MTEIRTFKSTALQSTDPGLSGASLIGVAPITGLSPQANNVETALEELAVKNLPPPGSETEPGILELATPMETQTGTDATRAVHPAGLKSELDRRGPIDAYAELTRGTDLSIPNSAFTAVAWNAETRDPLGWHGTTNPERVTPGVAGMYLATVFTAWTANATGLRRARLLRNGATVIAHIGMSSVAGMADTAQTLSTLVYLDAGEYLVAEVFQTSGGALPLSANSTLTVARIA